MAKQIARMFANGLPCEVMIKEAPWSKRGIWIDPTIKALIARGMIEPQGEQTEKNSFIFQPHALNAAGLFALENFLWERRTKATAR